MATKPYDYMAIVVQNGVPVYDKEKNTYVDKYAAQAEAEAEIEANLHHPTRDFSTYEEIPVIEPITAAAVAVQDVDDLPF